MRTLLGSRNLGTYHLRTVTHKLSPPGGGGPRSDKFSCVNFRVGFNPRGSRRAGAPLKGELELHIALSFFSSRDEPDDLNRQIEILSVGSINLTV